MPLQPQPIMRQLFEDVKITPVGDSFNSERINSRFSLLADSLNRYGNALGAVASHNPAFMSATFKQLGNPVYQRTIHINNFREFEKAETYLPDASINALRGSHLFFFLDDAPTYLRQDNTVFMAFKDNGEAIRSEDVVVRNVKNGVIILVRRWDSITAQLNIESDSDLHIIAFRKFCSETFKRIKGSISGDVVEFSATDVEYLGPLAELTQYRVFYRNEFDNSNQFFEINKTFTRNSNTSISPLAPPFSISESSGVITVTFSDLEASTNNILNPEVYLAYPTKIFKTGLSIGGNQDDVLSLSFSSEEINAIGPRCTKDYYKLYTRRNSNYFLNEIDPSFYEIQEDGEGIFHVTLVQNIVQTYPYFNTTDLIITLGHSSEFLESSFQYNQQTSPNSLIIDAQKNININPFNEFILGDVIYEIPLVKTIEINSTLSLNVPVGIKDEKDLFVWHNGRKLIPYQDFIINKNIYSDMHFQYYSLILRNGFPYGNHSFRVFSNGSPSINYDDVSDTSQFKTYSRVYRVTTDSRLSPPPSGTDFRPYRFVRWDRPMSYVIYNASLIFSNGRLVPKKKIINLFSNIVYLKDLWADNDLELYTSFIIDPVVKDFLAEYNELETEADKFIRIMNTVRNDAVSSFVSDINSPSSTSDLKPINNIVPLLQQPIFFQDNDVETGDVPGWAAYWLGRSDVLNNYLNGVDGAVNQDLAIVDNGSSISYNAHIVDAILDTSEDLIYRGYPTNVVFDSNITPVPITVNTFIDTNNS